MAEDHPALPPLKQAAMPGFPGWAKALGPGIVFMALAQGSGELIWWPYLVAKYGLGFLFLLIPACLLQFPLIYEIGRYTLLTGESIWQGLLRRSRPFAIFLWILMAISFLWFGAFASAGGTALAALTHFPQSLSPRGQSLFWAYATIALYFFALLFSPIIYRAIERFMMVVAVTTVLGLVISSLHATVFSVMPEFVSGLFIPQWPASRSWDPTDTNLLLTAIVFSGLGGFWTLFYSSWLRDKGVGMAARVGRITSPLTGRNEVISETGFLPEEESPSIESKNPFHLWYRYLFVDAGIGVLGNLFTTVLTCLLAYALLFPEGVFPNGWELATAQSKFFELRWGAVGRAIFLVVAAAFLTDTWMATVDAVARTHADMIHVLFPQSRKRSIRWWYYLFVVLLTLVTSITMWGTQPGPLIILSAIIGFAGTVVYTLVIRSLNYNWLSPQLPESARPGKFGRGVISITAGVYTLLLIAYLWVITKDALSG